MIQIEEVVAKRKVLFFRSPKDAVTLFRDARSLGLSGSGYIWLVSEEAINSASMEYAPQGEFAFCCA